MGAAPRVPSGTRGAGMAQVSGGCHRCHEQRGREARVLTDRAERAMTTTLTDQLHTGDVIEMTTGDGEAITVLVLLATDDALVLDPCNDETPFVLRLEELREYRKFDAEAMFAEA